MFALDTNTVIYYFKGSGHVAEHLLNTPPREIALPVIVLYELETGLAKSGATRRREQLDEFVRLITILPFGTEEAKAAAHVRAALERKGTPIGPYDTLIAATALHHHATLATRNVREFRRVAGLSVVNWHDQPITATGRPPRPEWGR